MQILDKSSTAPIINPNISFSLLADKPEFIPTIAAWYFNEWGHAQEGNSFEATCERIKGKLNRNQPPIHVVALKDNALVGVAQFKLHEMAEYPDKEHWLGSVFVDPVARGQGIALGLCEKVSELAASLGAKELYLSTEHLDGGVYARAGWSPYEQTVSRGDKVLVMVKVLSV